MNAPKLIVALDFDNQEDAFTLIDKLEPTQCALKVGSELFTLLGPIFVKLLVARDFKVFLDLKFHDIPNTVAKVCKVGADLGVWMMNVHASGGYKMMSAAREAIDSYGKDKPLLIAVTILTSFNQEDLPSIGITHSLTEQVKNLARVTRDAGLDGVVSSAHEVKLIKELCGTDFLTVTPGIRLLNNANDDQSRIMTPEQAIKQGSDYLVVGRPITQAASPERVVAEILAKIS